jgi:hypothetical protein
MINLDYTKLSDGGVHILLTCIVDGVSLRFVLDTGASHTVLDTDWAREHLTAKEIKLIEDPAQGIGAAVEVHKAVISEMIIGDLVLSNRRIALIDFTSINSIYRREGLNEVHGILGGDILYDHGAQIDYGKMQLAFSANR